MRRRNVRTPSSTRNHCSLLRTATTSPRRRWDSTDNSDTDINIRSGDNCRTRCSSPVIKVVWKSWGLPLTSYPSPLSPPSIYHLTPSPWAKSWGQSPPTAPSPITLSPAAATQPERCEVCIVATRDGCIHYCHANMHAFAKVVVTASVAAEGVCRTNITMVMRVFM